MEGPICVCVGEIWRAVCLGMSVCSQGLCVSFCVSRLPTSIMPWHSGREWDSDSFTNTRSVKLPVKLSCSVAILGIDKNTALKGKKLSSKCQRLCPCIKRERERERERKKKSRNRESLREEQQHGSRDGPEEPPFCIKRIIYRQMMQVLRLS